MQSIHSHFNLQGEISTSLPFGSGHINDTFRLVNGFDDEPDYLLQRINHKVFKDVDGMMENIGRVTRHIQSHSNNSGQQTLSVIPTLEGKPYYRDTVGNYWRIYIFMKGLRAFDVAESPKQIYEGAKAFGAFLHSLSTFPATSLSPTIPDFHNVAFRVSNLNNAVKKNSKGRVKEASHEIEFALKVAEEMCTIQKLGEAGKIPLRVTHNDTKFNNVLLDKAGIGRCVIDLDTVMPGYVHFDFGDGIRTTVTTAEEDEKDLKKIHVEMNRFEAFAKGYLEAAGEMLTPTEIQYLPLSGAMMAYIMGIRFLTDFLEGDRYYKIHYEGQNLIRAKSQLDLTEKIRLQIPEMEAIIRRLSGFSDS